MRVFVDNYTCLIDYEPFRYSRITSETPCYKRLPTKPNSIWIKVTSNPELVTLKFSSNE